jgi:hypothetical protein
VPAAQLIAIALALDMTVHIQPQRPANKSDHRRPGDASSDLLHSKLRNQSSSRANVVIAVRAISTADWNASAVLAIA